MAADLNVVTEVALTSAARIRKRRRALAFIAGFGLISATLVAWSPAHIARQVALLTAATLRYTYLRLAAPEQLLQTSLLSTVPRAEHLAQVAWNAGVAVTVPLVLLLAGLVALRGRQLTVLYLRALATKSGTRPSRAPSDPRPDAFVW